MATVDTKFFSLLEKFVKIFEFICTKALKTSFG